MMPCGFPDDGLASPLCGELGPPPHPGGRGYLCTRDAQHDGAHEAQVLDGRVVDTWPARRDDSR